MPTSTRFAVSVHALVLLARHDGRPVRSETIAADVGTNPAVIRALFSRLSAAGLVASHRGNGGGTILARAASEIRLLDAYLAVEDHEIFSVHRAMSQDTAAIGRFVVASLSAPLRQARQALEDELAAVSIADIAASMTRLQADDPAPGESATGGRRDDPLA